MNVRCLRSILVVMTFFAPLQTNAQHSVLNTTTYDSGLERMFSDMFEFFLVERLNLGEGFHASHYIPASIIAQQALAPAMGNLVSGNLAAFPLSSTQVGITLDFSTGVPVPVIDRQGPIFAETGQTLGRRKLAAGVSYTHLNLTRFRGMALDDLAFTFAHEDFTGTGVVGDAPSERDLVIIRPHLELTAGIIAIHATYGILDNLDIGIGLPIVNVSARGVAEAFVDSWTLENTGRAEHFLGGTPDNPVLEAAYRYDESETTLANIALQAKYEFPLEGALDAAALLDVRIPTGSNDRLLGKGALNYRIVLIGSTTTDLLNPHVNLGFHGRTADYDSDRLAFAVGFDRRITPGVTMAVNILGDLTLDTDQTIRLYDPALGPFTPVYRDAYPGTPEDVFLSNVPLRDNDNILNASIGARLAFSPHIQALANLIVPLRSGGLYATWVPTVGLTYMP